MQAIIDVIQSLIPYRGILVLFTCVPLLVIFCTLVSVVTKKLIYDAQKSKALVEKESLRDMDLDEPMSDEKKGYLQRVICSPESIDPNPQKYFVISDGGKEYYAMSYTIESMPKRATFANTFSDLMDFDGCTTSIYIHRLTEIETTRKMDRQIITLEAEFMTADKNGDTNRQRKLRGQYSDLAGWAEDVETGENIFFEVGFLFTLRADSLQKLFRMSDNFHSLALGKSIITSACIGVQPEAYMSNLPNIKPFSQEYGPVKNPAVKYHWMDKYSLSTIFNHTTSDFSHKNGVILGRNMYTGKPVMYDVYNPSHDGFTILICGKTGSGKSATIKILAERYCALKDYKFVAIDSQARGSVGEYAGLAEVLNGVNFQIKSGTDSILNPYELSESKDILTEGASGREVRTLKLHSKIAEVTNTVLTMIQGQESVGDFAMTKELENAVTSINKELYEERGIFEGDPDSLYTEGVDVMGGALTSGKVKKLLPTISDFYKKVLVKDKTTNNPKLKEIYRLVLITMKDYVKELYYSEDTLSFFTEEQYNMLPMFPGANYKMYEANGLKEKVTAIKGIRAYYDGQSNVSIGADCAFTNIDISQLTESERVLARQIALDFVNENFIKKNSEDVKQSRSMVVILDEAHENFRYEFARKTIDNVVRTARKRHVSMWISTQALAEYNNYEETKSILRNAAAKFIFKQDHQDREYLAKTLNLTDAQVTTILNLGGNDPTGQDKNGRRGEVCICDGSAVAFCKVQYLKNTESFSVETDAEEVKRLFNIQPAS